MSAVEVIVSGVLYDKLSRTARPVVLIGEASLQGVGIGGGPIIPPEPPLGIWGPGSGLPTPPIPIYPGGTPNPPGTWGPTDPRPGWGLPGGGGEGIWGPNDPRPTPPIHIPRPPVDPPDNPDFIKPPPPDGGWGWHPEYGWGYFPGTSNPGPKDK